MNQCRRRVTNLRKQECYNEVDDFPLCFDCLHILREIINNLKEYCDELENQITRQVKGAPSLGGGSDEQRLAFDYEASRARDDVEAVLSRWFARSTDPKAHASLQGYNPEQRVAILLAWHGRFYIHLGRNHDGPELLDDLDHALSKAMYACDRKQDKIWFGDCDSCGAAVRAFPKQQTLVTCKCGEEFDISKTRRRMHVAGGQQIVTLRQAQKMGEVWGRKFNSNTVRSWLRRGKIQCQNEDCGTGCVHTYRMSDLLVLHKEG